MAVLSLVEVDGWKRAHKHAQKNTEKEHQGNGKVFGFGRQGRIKAASHYYSLAVQAASLKIDEQTRTKHVVFLAALSGPLHLPYPTASNVCRLFFRFRTRFSFALPCVSISAGFSLGLGHWDERR